MPGAGSLQSRWLGQPEWVLECYAGPAVGVNGRAVGRSELNVASLPLAGAKPMGATEPCEMHLAGLAEIVAPRASATTLPASTPPLADGSTGRRASFLGPDLEVQLAADLAVP